MRFRIYTFENGAKIVYKRYRHGGNATSFCGGFLCGTEYTKNGLSHLFEHMLFKGTTNRTAKQIIDDEANLCNINAHTNKTFMGVDAYCSNRILEKVFDFTSDVLFNSTFPEDTLKNEVNVVKEERARDANNKRNDIRFFHFKVLMTNTYKDIDDYSSIIFGSDQSLDNFSRQDMLDFREKHYVSGKFILFVCSTKPLSKIKRLCKKYFVSKIKNQTKDVEILPYPDRIYGAKEGLQVVSTDSKNIKLRVSIVQEVEDVKKYLYDWDRTILQYIMETKSNLIYNQLRDAGLIYSAGVVCLTDMKKNVNIDLTLQTSKIENIDKILTLYGETIKDLKENGVTKEDVDGFKFKFFNREDYPASYDNNSELMSRVSDSYLRYGKDSPYKDLTKRLRKKLVKKSNEQTINKSIHEIFDKNNRVFITLLGNISQEDARPFEEYRKMIFQD